MSNLSELLPAGAGGKNVSFVASGTLSNAKAVALKTNGQIELISSSNITNFIGITAAAISSGSTGVVVLQGGVATNLSSLTIGSEYYVQGNGTISTASASPAVNIGKAISATALILKG